MEMIMNHKKMFVHSTMLFDVVSVYKMNFRRLALAEHRQSRCWFVIWGKMSPTRAISMLRNDKKDKYLISCFLKTWWRHQMEAFSALLALCAGNSPISGEFPAQRPVTRSFGVFIDLRLIKRLSKHSRGWWFETLSSPLWRHCNELHHITDKRARPNVHKDWGPHFRRLTNAP